MPNRQRKAPPGNRDITPPDFTPIQKARWCKKRVPYGMTEFQLTGEEEWHPISELPLSWGFDQTVQEEVYSEEDVDEQEVRHAADAAWRARKNRK